MIVLGVIFGLYVVGSLFVIHKQQENAREERSELEDRLMALSKPDAAILHKAQRDQEPGDVRYEDTDEPDPEFGTQIRPEED